MRAGPLYSRLSGILHKGSGENVFISEQQPPVISSIMGNGRRRSISCPSCSGLAEGNKLLAPVALACDGEGNLYVGDLNFVRRVYPSLNTTTILELRSDMRVILFFSFLFLKKDIWIFEFYCVSFCLLSVSVTPH